MSAAELLSAARAAGLTVDVEGDRLVVRGPKSAGDLARQLLGRKADLIRELCGRDPEIEATAVGITEDDVVPLPATPPPGARLFCQRRTDNRPCGPGDDVYLWTWEGASTWYHADRNPVPT